MNGNQGPEWTLLKDALNGGGVTGSGELGRFVNDTEYFAPSEFDERAAMPILLGALPKLSESNLVQAVAGHLHRPWARPAAFDPLYDAFRKWAPREPTVGWAIGDSLANATPSNPIYVNRLVEFAVEPSYGMARQMIVYSLYRFKSSVDVESALRELVHDESVGLHAMSALQRTIGPAAALPVFQAVALEHSGTQLGRNADKKAKAIRKNSR